MLGDLPDRFTVTAICDVLDFRLENAKKTIPSITPKVYKDYRQVLDDRSIQAVVIATTLSEHYRIAKDALLAGKHIYLEKAMTYSIDQALDLVKTSKAHAGQVVQVGHQYRSTPLYFKVKEMIDKGYQEKLHRSIHAGTATGTGAARSGFTIAINR